VFRDPCPVFREERAADRAPFRPRTPTLPGFLKRCDSMGLRGWGSAKDVIPKGLIGHGWKSKKVEELREVGEEEENVWPGEFCSDNTRKSSTGLSWE
jgi:hypothetical protein